jgi:hypothetical protein
MVLDSKIKKKEKKKKNKNQKKKEILNNIAVPIESTLVLFITENVIIPQNTRILVDLFIIP